MALYIDFELNYEWIGSKFSNDQCAGGPPSLGTSCKVAISVAKSGKIQVQHYLIGKLVFYAPGLSPNKFSRRWNILESRRSRGERISIVEEI